MTDQEKILDKLQKIKAQAEGEAALGNEAAAQAFADMLQKMLLRHKLEMSDLEFEREEKSEPVGEHRIDYKKYGVKVGSRRTEWMELLAKIIAENHFCDILVQRGSTRITLVGRKQDVEVAEYMYMVLVRAAENIADSEYSKYSLECVAECRQCGRDKKAHYNRGGTLYCEQVAPFRFEPNWEKCRGFKKAFLISFIRRLDQRFRERRRETVSESTALIRLNRADAAVKAFMNEKYGKKHAAALTGNVRFNREGDRRGREAANSVNLNANAVRGGGAPTLLKG